MIQSNGSEQSLAEAKPGPGAATCGLGANDNNKNPIIIALLPIAAAGCCPFALFRCAALQQDEEKKTPDRPRSRPPRRSRSFSARPPQTVPPRWLCRRLMAASRPWPFRSCRRSSRRLGHRCSPRHPQANNDASNNNNLHLHLHHHSRQRTPQTATTTTTTASPRSRSRQNHHRHGRFRDRRRRIRRRSRVLLLLPRPAGAGSLAGAPTSPARRGSRPQRHTTRPTRRCGPRPTRHRAPTRRLLLLLLLLARRRSRTSRSSTPPSPGTRPGEPTGATSTRS